jgi:hypothetical protein
MSHATAMEGGSADYAGAVYLPKARSREELKIQSTLQRSWFKSFWDIKASSSVPLHSFAPLRENGI